jgi:hypothetical protein
MQLETFSSDFRSAGSSRCDALTGTERTRLQCLMKPNARSVVTAMRKCKVRRGRTRAQSRCTLLVSDVKRSVKPPRLQMMLPTATPGSAKFGGSRPNPTERARHTVPNPGAHDMQAAINYTH